MAAHSSWTLDLPALGSGSTFFSDFPLVAENLQSAGMLARTLQDSCDTQGKGMARDLEVPPLMLPVLPSGVMGPPRHQAHSDCHVAKRHPQLSVAQGGPRKERCLMLPSSHSAWCCRLSLGSSESGLGPQGKPPLTSGLFPPGFA